MERLGLTCPLLHQPDIYWLGSLQLVQGSSDVSLCDVKRQAPEHDGLTLLLLPWLLPVVLLRVVSIRVVAFFRSIAVLSLPFSLLWTGSVPPVFPSIVAFDASLLTPAAHGVLSFLVSSLSPLTPALIVATVSAATLCATHPLISSHFNGCHEILKNL